VNHLVRAWIGLIVCVILTAADAKAQGPASAPATADTPAPASDLIRVFLDCNQCDGVYLRQNVGFVDYVRDRTDADFHVLVTTQGMGGGGTSWVVRFIGLRNYAGQDRTLSFETESTATADDRRRAFARIFRLGLVGFAAATSVAPALDVTWRQPAGAQAASAVTDPWNYWVFTINGSGNINGERSRSARSHNMRVSADRTTEDLKIIVNASRNSRTTTFEIDDDETIKSRTYSWNLNGRLVKSVGPRWSVGATGSMSHSSFSNVDLAASLAPAIEVNLFPYSESELRSFTLHYAIGATRYRYAEPTIFDKLEETTPRHAFNAALSLRQPWGTLYANGNVSQHLNQTDRYRAGVYGSTNVRLFRGFSFNVYAEYQKINDQISLRKAGASEEEVLLQLRQLATSYSYEINFGVSYRFGSPFNNVVNTRFDESAF
jgi:hypothetical protein